MLQATWVSEKCYPCYSPHFKSKGDSFSNNTIGTTSTNMELYLVSKFPNSHMNNTINLTKQHHHNYWNWVYYWMKIKYIYRWDLFIYRNNLQLAIHKYNNTIQSIVGPIRFVLNWNIIQIQVGVKVLANLVYISFSIIFLHCLVLE